VHTNFGKVFDYPTAVFDEAMLKPETQDLAAFVDGIDNVYETQQRVALIYFQDGTINDACPPLKALLHVMAYGHYEGKTIDDPAIRDLFTRESLLASDWYRERLSIKHQRDLALWQRHRDIITERLTETENSDPSEYSKLEVKLEKTETMLAELSQPGYLESLIGTLGADWVHH
jgi:hypothetical protein